MPNTLRSAYAHAEHLLPRAAAERSRLPAELLSAERKAPLLLTSLYDLTLHHAA